MPYIFHRPFPRHTRALLILGLFPLAACSHDAAARGSELPPTVTLKPGDDIQDAVKESPEGTTFLFEPGLYRLQVITPKDGQKFIGRDGAVLNGAMLLVKWERKGGLWIADNIPPPLRLVGKCSKSRPLCMYREDVFVDGKVYERVAGPEELGPGKWFYKKGKVHMSDDPTGKMVEFSMVGRAFAGNADNVEIRNLVVEKYASAAQHGAIDGRGTKGWRVIDVTARWNHGVGLYIGGNMVVKGGSFSHNGQLGIGGGDGDGAVVEGTEIAYNNYAGFSGGWEAGATKFVRTENLTVRNNCVHHNYGHALWTDIDNNHTLYEGNVVFENAGDGIKHEISGPAIIRNNISARNGLAFDNWLWGSQILVQNSSGVEVTGNTVEVSAEGGNGLSLIQQERHHWLSGENRFHNNRVIFLGTKGRTGMVNDYGRKSKWFWNKADNVFEANAYVVPDAKRNFYGYRDRFRTFSWVVENGMEQGGTVREAETQPLELTCP